MNILEESPNNLAPVNYKELLEKIGQIIPTMSQLFGFKTTSFLFNADLLASEVARQMSTPLFENRDGTTYASTHFADLVETEAFSVQVKQLQQVLRTTLQTRFIPSPEYSSLSEYVSKLFQSIGDFAQPGTETTGLHYEQLKKPLDLQRQRLHVLPRKPTDTPWLKGHKLTLQVRNISSFDAQLIQGICTSLEQNDDCDPQDIPEVRDVLKRQAENKKTAFSDLRRALIKHSLARIQRDARVKYLKYLCRGIEGWKAEKTKKEGLKLLETLITRLEMLETYVRQSKEDGHFQVTYGKNTFNYRELFTRADAFDSLPIIPEIQGTLGEMTDWEHDTKTFVSSLKLKLNGSVQVHGGSGDTAYKYHLVFLDPNSKAYQQRESDAGSKFHFQEKVLKIAMLYFFVFINMDDSGFHPASRFETEILTVFQTGTEEEKYAALRSLQDQISNEDVHDNLQILRTMLVAFLDQQSIGPVEPEETLVLHLSAKVLIEDVDEIVMHHHFFQDGIEKNDGKNALKYISIEQASTSADALCKLPISMAFEPLYYYAGENPVEAFTMRYEAKNVKSLPIFLAPVEPNVIGKYKDAYKDEHYLLCAYRHHPEVRFDSSTACIYRITYILMTYLLIRFFAENVTGGKQNKLFFPIICLHNEVKVAEEQNKQDDETFVHAYSKILAHMLAEDYMASSQGFHLDSTVQDVKSAQWKRPNALSSLYSALPRRFYLHGNLPTSAISTTLDEKSALKQLAIIVVSSRRCDANTKVSAFYKSTIYGEVIGIERFSDGAVRVSTLSTFSGNQEAKQMHIRPEVIIEQVKTCYAQGYQHFLYVPQAPYSSTLHIADRNANEELFFMNKEVIQAMRDVGLGIKVYPVFCDKYYVVNQKRHERPGLKVDSLYIDDLGELSILNQNRTLRTKRSFIFLNLFNGISVNKQVYNGVMSYSTLVNVYANDPTYDQYIWSDVLGERKPNSLAMDLLDGITLLHFSRYEKAGSRKEDRGFKLDPYTRIIGDTSVGKISLFPHMNGRTQFNSLAFLTLVRSVLQAQ
jgi:hypothetical protein